MHSEIAKRIKRTIFRALLIFSLLLARCTSLSTSPINKILENPRDYAGRTVTISGEVTEVFSLFVIKYFIVKDKTGQIVVVTERPLPNVGAKIVVKGTVEEAFSIGDKRLIVIVEKEPPPPTKETK
jgi:hypothetical protein